MSSVSKITISNASLADVDELHNIEILSFPSVQAAGKDAFIYRLTEFPQWFYKAEIDGKIVGLVNGSSSTHEFITDDLYLAEGGFDEGGDYLLIYGLAVHPDFRKHGIAHELLSHILCAAKARDKKRASLTCKEHLIGFYESFGFKNHGISESVIGDVVSYDMEIDL